MTENGRAERREARGGINANTIFKFRQLVKREATSRVLTSTKLQTSTVIISRRESFREKC